MAYFLFIFFFFNKDVCGDQPSKGEAVIKLLWDSAAQTAFQKVFRSDVRR